MIWRNYCPLSDKMKWHCDKVETSSSKKRKLVVKRGFLPYYFTEADQRRLLMESRILIDVLETTHLESQSDVTENTERRWLKIGHRN